MTMTEEVLRLKCPACGNFIGTTDGAYFEAVPCSCGVQTTVRVKRRRISTIEARGVTVAKT